MFFQQKDMERHVDAHKGNVQTNEAACQTGDDADPVPVNGQSEMSQSPSSSNSEHNDCMSDEWLTDAVAVVSLPETRQQQTDDILITD